MFACHFTLDLKTWPNFECKLSDSQPHYVRILFITLLSHLPGKFELQIIRYEIGVALSPLLCIVRASTMQEYFFISALNVGESQLRLGLIFI